MPPRRRPPARLLLACLAALAGACAGPARSARDTFEAPDATADSAGTGLTEVVDTLGPDARPDASRDSEGGASCGACHGQGDDPAPPPDLSGATDPGARGVGAHAAHLAPLGAFAPARCKHCHPVPGTLDAPGHVDDARPADVIFQGLAAADLDPRYEGGACLVLCHGGALHGVPRWSPPWTAGAITCGDCHGLPPALPHPAATDCGRCHLDVAGPAGAILRPDLHADSIVNAPHGAHMHHLGAPGGADLACDACHVGTAYHGALKDGGTLDTTGLCDACHDTSLDRARWHVDPW